MDYLFITSYSWPLVIVRVVLGVIMFAHGAQKLFGWFGGYGLRGTSGYMKEALGIPPLLTTLAALTETFGGLALIIGFLSRPAALGIIVVMAVAITKAHKGNGFFINWAMTEGKGHGYEMHLALIAMALAVLAGGAGLLSVDLAILY